MRPTGRKNDWPGDPKSLQLGPPRLAGPQRGHQGDCCLLPYELCEKPLNEGLRREAPCILARQREGQAVVCDREGIRPPWHIPANLPVETIGEEVYCVRAPPPVCLLKQASVDSFLSWTQFGLRRPNWNHVTAQVQPRFVFWPCRARGVDAPARRRLVLEHQPRGQRAGSRYAWDLLEGHFRKVHRLRHPNPCLWPLSS